MKKLIILSIIFLIGCENKINQQIPQNQIDIKKQNYTQIQLYLLEEHNKQRKNKGLDILSIDKDLCAYAQKHAEKMAEKNSMYHSKMSDLKKISTNADWVGENVAWGQKDEKEVMNNWMWSPGHRYNILGKSYKRAGFGSKQDSKGRIYWCAVFSS
jgi:uncharacterized protein YkwD